MEGGFLFKLSGLIASVFSSHEADMVTSLEGSNSISENTLSSLRSFIRQCPSLSPQDSCDLGQLAYRLWNRAVALEFEIDKFTQNALRKPTLRLTYDLMNKSERVPSISWFSVLNAAKSSLKISLTLPRKQERRGQVGYVLKRFFVIPAEQKNYLLADELFSTAKKALAELSRRFPSPNAAQHDKRLNDTFTLFCWRAERVSSCCE
jgi:hypothetical protein